LSRFEEKLNILNCVNLTGNYVHYMYEFSGFTKNLNYAVTLNVQNCVNPMEHSVHCVHYMYRLSRIVEKLNI